MGVFKHEWPIVFAVPWWGHLTHCVHDHKTSLLYSVYHPWSLDLCRLASLLMCYVSVVFTGLHGPSFQPTMFYPLSHGSPPSEMYKYELEVTVSLTTSPAVSHLLLSPPSRESERITKPNPPSPIASEKGRHRLFKPCLNGCPYGHTHLGYYLRIPSPSSFATPRIATGPSHLPKDGRCDDPGACPRTLEAGSGIQIPPPPVPDCWSLAWVAQRLSIGP
ncbi:hypothetical protein BDM02DRAFT_1835750 [Thelephora ganbajun]|uniref:Uncharacterized protein n=1 Tax=Thelephora ganbajun TaxID=370292 RepID=A0ACB6ZJJ6_THEGA|nr:hypothetical protein BDM02DRAFT_1835750 [Thelephora ganbajun]